MVTNVELDHHAEYALARRPRARVRRLARRRPRTVVRDAPPYDGELALPGELNRLNAGSALAALEPAGVTARRGGTRARSLHRHRPPVRGARDRRLTVVDDYGHHPTEVARTLAAVRERYPGAPVRVLFQPHLYSRTRHLAGELAEALAAADDVTVTDVYPAREQPIPGVTGKLVVDALSDRGVLAGWTPTVEEGVERVAPAAAGRRRAPGRRRRRHRPAVGLLRTP